MGATADGVVGEARGRGRLEGKVREAANMIAALLLAGADGVPEGLVEEAEALLETLRGEDS